jgi:hypothetical protein
MIDALPLLLGPEGYQISRSVRLRSSASAYFNRTPASAGNRKTWTWSGWGKIDALSACRIFAARVDDNNRFVLAYVGSTQFNLQVSNVVSGTGTVWAATSALLRDPSAWYHFVVAFDSTQATATNRLKVYINGVEQILSTDNRSSISQNYDGYVNNNTAHYIGTATTGAGNFSEGYLTEINFIDGQALTPSSFGVFNAYGVWSPTKYNGTYGTNGFYLNFSDPSAATAAAIGKDYSGNGNNWTPNNISVTAGATYDSMLDVPTPWADGGNGRGNYCVWNPIDPNALIGGGIVDGNLLGYPANTAGRGVLKGTIVLPTSGQYYFEITPTVLTSAVAIIGICKTTVPYNASSFSAGDLYAYRSTPDGWNGATTITYGASYTTNDVIGVAFDASAGTITFYKNGASQGQAYSGISGEYTPFAADQTTGGVTQYALNCGQRPFAYTPPTGFKALNTLNLPEPTILKGNQFFDATIYTGTAATQNVVNAGAFQPDLVWTKRRSVANSHQIFDSIRGVTAKLSSDTTAAETSAEGQLTSFNTNGFTVPNNAYVNSSPDAFVAWQWKEGATQGFDIVTYTGTGSNTTIAHNLGVAPRMMIVKRRSGASDWIVWHSTFAGTEYIALNTTAAKVTGATIWNSTSPTSSVFSVGTSGATNGNTDTYVAYLFAEVAGFSKAFSYTGNGSTDGPFVFLGFRPRWILIKRTDSAGYSWLLHDTARSPENPSDELLVPNTSSAESTAAAQNIDFVSNGFKLRTSDAFYNASGGTYIYAAFAENPFKYSLAR